MKLNTKSAILGAAIFLSSLPCTTFAVEHNHGHYTYEPVTINGTTYECPCDLPNNIVGRQFRLEFSKQEEIQDLINNKNKIKKSKNTANNANTKGHNHRGYNYEPVTISGITYNCPCEISGNYNPLNRDFRLEFNKQEEIQDLLKEKGKSSKPRYTNIKHSVSEPVVENGLPESGRIFYDIDDVFMQTTNKEEFEDFFKRYVSRKYTCNEVGSLNFAVPQNGDLKILIGMDGTPCIVSKNMNVNSLGIKVGSATWKFVQVPVRVEGYQFVNNRWIPIGAIKVLSEQTIKDDPRKIYKNAMNDSINYFTSPEDRITRALFENGIKHRSVFDHMSNW